MKICKYCKKPISDSDQVWNPDDEGNGYHHVCLCEMEFDLRDKQIYNQGRMDVLDKIRTEIKEQVLSRLLSDGDDDVFATVKVNECLEIIDKYRTGREE